MKNLTDILAEMERQGFELGKIYTDKDRPPFKVNEDKEGKMAKYDAKEIADDAMDVFKMIKEEDDLPEWLEAKVTKAADYMNSVKDYLTHHQNGVKEGNIGITTKKDKTIELTHRKSGKEIVVQNSPSVLKKYAKMGYLISMPEGKVKPKQKISKKEWRKIKKFNKHIGQDGTHYVMQLTNKGTALVPVVVEGDNNGY